MQHHSIYKDYIYFYRSIFLLKMCFVAIRTFILGISPEWQTYFSKMGIYLALEVCLKHYWAFWWYNFSSSYSVLKLFYQEIICSFVFQWLKTDLLFNLAEQTLIVFSSFYFFEFLRTTGKNSWYYIAASPNEAMQILPSIIQSPVVSSNDKTKVVTNHNLICPLIASWHFLDIDSPADCKRGAAESHSAKGLSQADERSFHAIPSQLKYIAHQRQTKISSLLLNENFT